MTKVEILKKFQTIPGVGKSIANDLWNLGFRSIEELEKHSPEELYERLCRYTNTRVDRCMLYVFRCVHYYVKNTKHDPLLLLWWNWKDKKSKKQK